VKVLARAVLSDRALGRYSPGVWRAFHEAKAILGEEYFGSLFLQPGSDPEEGE